MYARPTPLREKLWDLAKFILVLLVGLSILVAIFLLDMYVISPEAALEVVVGPDEGAQNICVTMFAEGKLFRALDAYCVEVPGDGEPSVIFRGLSPGQYTVQVEDIRPSEGENKTPRVITRWEYGVSVEKGFNSIRVEMPLPGGAPDGRG